MSTVIKHSILSLPCWVITTFIYLKLPPLGRSMPPPPMYYYRTERTAAVSSLGCETKTVRVGCFVVFTDSGLVLVQRGWLQVRTTVAVWEPRPWPLATLCSPSVTPTATFTSTPRSPSLPIFLSKWVQRFDVFRSSSSWTFALFNSCCTISAWISESSYII